jgi:hypothetical protein
MNMTTDPGLSADHLAGLQVDDQKRLIGSIDALFEKAIDSRSPRQRPPGKAGLKAEKEYYRLLYLQADFQAKHRAASPPNDPHLLFDWSALDEVWRQLGDLPELRSEMQAGLKAALEQLGAFPAADKSGPFLG